MIKVSVAFTCWGSAMHRVWSSLKKYLPDDVEIVQSQSAETQYKSGSDLLITHLGITEYNPYLAYITPKVVLSERTDDVALSYFGKNDLLLTFHPEVIQKIRNRGVNVLLWPRPVDQDIFYPTPEAKDIGVLTVDASHGEWVYRADRCLAAIPHLNHVILYGRGGRVGFLPGMNIEQFDYCPLTDDGIAKLRLLYCRSKYTMSMQGMITYRETETAGIEIGNMEAIFCGSVPIILDMDGGEYLKYWYGDYAKFVSIDNFEEDLDNVLRSDYILLTDAQIASAVAKCGADVVWDKFWVATRKVL